MIVLVGFVKTPCMVDRSGGFADDFDFVEAQKCTTGRTPKIESPELTIYEARVLNADFKHAEALSIVGNGAGLQDLRTKLARGQLSQAKRVLKDLVGHEDRGELGLESARLKMSEGCWEEVVEICTETLTVGVSPVTCLTLHQLRALAEFELGRWDQSSADLEIATSLSALYPHAVSAFYSDVLSLRLQARIEGPQEARQGRDRLILKNHKPWNRDHLLTLLRLELDLRRLEGRSIAQYAIACLLLSESIGDPIYAALAAIDLVACGVKDAKLGAKINEACAKYPRIKRLVDEVQSQLPVLTHARDLVQQHRESLSKTSPEMKNVDFLVWEPANIVMSFETNQIRAACRAPKLFSAISILSKGPISKEDFFRVNWGISKFSSEKHDGAIRTLLYRIRKELSLKINSDQRTLTVNALFLGDQE